MNTMKTTLIMLAAAIMTGCTWVKASHDAAAQVRVLNHQHIEACQQLGRTTVSVLDSIAFVPRSKAQVKKELEILARDSAAEIDGDSVVAISKIIDGEQVYNIYRCGLNDGQ